MDKRSESGLSFGSYRVFMRETIVFFPVSLINKGNHLPRNSAWSVNCIKEGNYLNEQTFIRLSSIFVIVVVVTFVIVGSRESSQYPYLRFMASSPEVSIRLRLSGSKTSFLFCIFGRVIKYGKQWSSNKSKRIRSTLFSGTFVCLSTSTQYFGLISQINRIS